MTDALPTGFIDGLSGVLPPEEMPHFRAALSGTPPVSVQLNPHKSTDLPYPIDVVPWYAGGRYLTDRPVFTLDPSFQAGAYYVQEAGSMFIAHLAQTLLPADRPWKILDLCASPGGKSCLLSSVAPAGSLMVSNEIIKSRYNILRYNLAKWGHDNRWTTNLDPERFSTLTGFFDLVLVDAPCSGEGLFRKDPKAREEWSPEAVSFCGLRQERILRAAAPLLAPEGVLLYSTCTYNQRENEQQASLLTDLGYQIEQPEVPAEWNLLEKSAGYHFFPHRVRSEGFFALAARQQIDHRPKKYRSKPFPHLSPLAKRYVSEVNQWLQAPEQHQLLSTQNGRILALSKQRRKEAEILATALGRIDLGIPLGEFKGKALVPSAELALHTILSPQLPRLEVDRRTAQLLLKRETPTLPENVRGRYLITHEGLGLLWIKGLGNRYNNNYPTAWRIRMALD